MSDHDPLCWRKQDYVPICSMCVLIASTRADERERIAQAIESKADDLPIEDYVLPDHVDMWRQARADLHDAARIARNGARNE